MTDVCTTPMQLLLMVTHRVPSVAVLVIPYLAFSYHMKNISMEEP